MATSTPIARRPTARETGAMSLPVGDVAVVAGLTLVLRAAWVLLYGRTSAGPNDTIFYLISSNSLAHGHGFSTLYGEPTAHWPPGYPFGISLLYRAFGPHPELALGLNVVLAVATAVLLYGLARRMFGREGGLVAGLAFAVLPGPIFFTGLVLSETSFVFGLVAFLALAVHVRDRRWAPVALGVAVGLTALTRGEGLLMLVIPLAMWWDRRAWRGWLVRGGLLLATALLVILPWTIRNANVMHAFIPVATNASTTLWSGHNPSANGGPSFAPPELLARIKEKNSVAHEVGEARLLRREAISWARTHPRRELTLIPRKLWSLLTSPASDVFPIWVNAKGERQIGARSRAVIGGIGNVSSWLLVLVTLSSLVVVGVRTLWRLHPGMRGVLAYLALCLFVYGFVYFGQNRYRMPMEPLMILVATPLALELWKRRPARGRG